ncbi:MAG: hypothetical protein LBP59_18510 [Planctomycetaceae bacterium]|jgi:hypothetical protein|nr:hypothetical protein [Planctomycetaceae bacterium]
MKNFYVFILAIFIFGVAPYILNAAQYARSNGNQEPFIKDTNYNPTYTNNKTTKNYTLKTQTKQQKIYANNQQITKQQQNNSVTKIRQLPQPKKQPKNQNAANNFRKVQFSGELFDIDKTLFNDDDFTTNAPDTLILPKRNSDNIVIEQNNRQDNLDGTNIAGEVKPPLKLITPIKPNHVPSAGFLKYSDEYPDPRSIGVTPAPYNRGGILPAPYSFDRHAAVPEEEVQHRRHIDEIRKQTGQTPLPAAECPLCKDDPKTPCGQCDKCKQGYPCEKTVCRHCVQPLSRDMNNFCDLTAGGEPCGTCDSCREHRSDPCEHAADGRGPHGEWNPYKQSRIFAVIPRPILDEYNNGARKFPVYYNPAPYYRPYWNPSLYAGYARPYTFRYTCPVCSDGVCKCDQPPFAGQVPFAYTCKFCNRNPCACAENICDANAEMKPSGRLSAAAKKDDAKINETQNSNTKNQNENNNANENNNETIIDNNKKNNNDEQSIEDLLNEKSPIIKPNSTIQRSPNQRQKLDSPKIIPPTVIPPTGIVN